MAKFWILVNNTAVTVYTCFTIVPSVRLKQPYRRQNDDDGRQAIATALYMQQLTIGDKGSYIYAAFGAPIAREDDPVRAGALFVLPLLAHHYHQAENDIR